MRIANPRSDAGLKTAGISHFIYAELRVRHSAFCITGPSAGANMHALSDPASDAAVPLAPPEDRNVAERATFEPPGQDLPGRHRERNLYLRMQFAAQRFECRRICEGARTEVDLIGDQTEETQIGVNTIDSRTNKHNWGQHHRTMDCEPRAAGNSVLVRIIIPLSPNFGLPKRTQLTDWFRSLEKRKE